MITQKTVTKIVIPVDKMKTSSEAGMGTVQNCVYNSVQNIFVSYVYAIPFWLLIFAVTLEKGFLRESRNQSEASTDATHARSASQAT